MYCGQRNQRCHYYLEDEHNSARKIQETNLERDLGSALELLLGQGAEWKIQTENQRKEWKIFTYFMHPSFSIRQNRLNIEHKWHQSPHIFCIAYLLYMYQPFKYENWKNTTKILTATSVTTQESGKLSSILREESGILVLLGCRFSSKFPNTRTLDLGVFISNTLKASSHCQRAARECLHCASWR